MCVCTRVGERRRARRRGCECLCSGAAHCVCGRRIRTKDSPKPGVDRARVDACSAARRRATVPRADESAGFRGRIHGAKCGGAACLRQCGSLGGNGIARRPAMPAGHGRRAPRTSLDAAALASPSGARAGREPGIAPSHPAGVRASAAGTGLESRSTDPSYPSRAHLDHPREHHARAQGTPEPVPVPGIDSRAGPGFVPPHGAATESSGDAARRRPGNTASGDSGRLTSGRHEYSGRPRRDSPAAQRGRKTASQRLGEAHRGRTGVVDQPERGDCRFRSGGPAGK